MIFFLGGVPVFGIAEMGVVKFWKVVPVFMHGKRVEIQLLNFLKFMRSCGLGYCINGVAEKKAAG